MALHSIQGNTLYFLIGMHVLAALWHHYVLKDSALKRMRWR
jgi:cytochrome b561